MALTEGSHFIEMFALTDVHITLICLLPIYEVLGDCQLYLAHLASVPLS